jgi:hypothetical protein
VFSREAINTNLIVFGLTQSGLEPMIYHTRGLNPRSTTLEAWTHDLPHSRRAHESLHTNVVCPYVVVFSAKLCGHLNELKWINVRENLRGQLRMDNLETLLATLGIQDTGWRQIKHKSTIQHRKLKIRATWTKQKYRGWRVSSSCFLWDICHVTHIL